MSLAKNISDSASNDLINVSSATKKQFQTYMSKQFGEEIFNKGYRLIESKYSDYIFEENSEKLFAENLSGLNFAND